MTTNDAAHNNLIISPCRQFFMAYNAHVQQRVEHANTRVGHSCRSSSRRRLDDDKDGISKRAMPCLDMCDLMMSERKANHVNEASTLRRARRRR